MLAPFEAIVFYKGLKMQLQLLPDDYSSKKVFIGMSGGVDSMGALCYLASVYPQNLRPGSLYLFYVHIKEHSADTIRFVRDGVKYARKHFDNVVFEFFNAGSVLDYFEKQNMIPHPMFSPCSIDLKMKPVEEFKAKHGLTIDITAYIRSEKRRINRAVKHGAVNQGKVFLVSHLLQEDIFRLVYDQIGWVPAIYEIKDDSGRRVFKHNNCLPCKNMSGNLGACSATGEFLDVLNYYPKQALKAMETAGKLDAYFGRGDFDGNCTYCEV